MEIGETPIALLGLSSRAVICCQAAIKYCPLFKMEKIEPEAILYAILRENKGMGVRSLEAAGYDVGDIIETVKGHMPGRKHLGRQPRVPTRKVLSETSVNLIEAARIEARRLNAPTTNTGHLLLAMLHDTNKGVGLILHLSGVTFRGIEDKLMELQKTAQESP